MRKTGRLRYQEHAVAGLFVFVLLALFALLSMLLVIIGAQTYRSITVSAEMNTQRRLGVSYVANRVRSADQSGGITLEQYGDITAIVQHVSAEDGAYENRIYCCDGELREQFVRADVPFDAQQGRTVSEIARMDVQMTAERVLYVEIEQADGTVETMHVRLRSE